MNAAPLIGRVLVEARPMTDQELEAEGWVSPGRLIMGRPVVLVFSDETRIYASMDDEGNGPGTLFVRDPLGNPSILEPDRHRAGRP
jgi:hypothetical protein